MRLVIYECPRTHRSVLAAVDNDLFDARAISIPMGCPLCKRTHLIDPDDAKLAMPKQASRHPKVQPHTN